MISYWVKLDSTNSNTFSVNDSLLWEEAIEQFKIDCKISQPLSSTITIIPQESGVIIHGHLSGKVLIPCDRCTADINIPIDHDFDDFESIPSLSLHYKGNTSKKIHEENIFREVNGIIEMNLANILWEEFILSLPIKPLCSNNCKGLCYRCGKDLNKDQCNCIQTKDDPRLAALKNITIDN